jgi:hypothetical protein
MTINSGMELLLDEKEINTGDTALQAITGNNRPAICLFTNATGDKLYPAKIISSCCKNSTNTSSAIHVPVG